MSGFVTALSELLGGLSQSFRLSAFVPAALFVLGNLVLSELYLRDTIIFRALTGSNSVDLALGFGAVLTLSYSLSSLNVPLTQLYEGYLFRHTVPGRLLTLLQIQRWQWIDLRIAALNELIEDQRRKVTTHRAKIEAEPWLYPGYWNAYQRLIRSQTEIAILEDERERYFPTEEDLILPTRLGNVIVAFEEYPRRRYGIDAVTVWPRLLPTLVKSGYAEIVERQKMGFDFFLNLSFLSGLLAVEYSVVSMHFAARLHIGVLLGCLIAAWLFYRFATLAALNFGNAVKVSFDLHRKALREAVGIVEPSGYQQERVSWSLYSGFLAMADQPDPVGESDKTATPERIFQYPKPLRARRKSRERPSRSTRRRRRP